jgi:phosphoribosylformylglycinamidine synthase
VTSQYDSTVGSDTVVGSDRGAAVLRVKGTPFGLVAAADANASVSALDPWLGAALSVCEAARNVAITGARPLGITDCLNFGDPQKPEAFWQLSQAIAGIADAARALGLPVVSGNVSLYNESPAGRILPTPEIGVVGLLDDINRRVGPAFAADGEIVALAGEVAAGLGGSAYATVAGAAAEDGPPPLELAREVALQEFLRSAIGAGVVTAAQDVGTGGLAVALAEMAIWGERGAELHLRVRATPAVELFGESPSRAVVTCRPGDWDRLTKCAAAVGVPLERLGQTGGERLRIELAGKGATGAAEERGGDIADPIDAAVASLRDAWTGGLPAVLEES